MSASPDTDAILGLLAQYDDLRARAEVTAVSPELFELAGKSVEASITNSLTGALAELCLSHVDAAVAFQLDLEALRAAGIDGAAIQEAALSAPNEVKLGTIALRWLNPALPSPHEEPTDALPVLPSSLILPEFFNRPPEQVATEMAGKRLVLGDKELTIASAQGQEEAENQSWLHLPIFGDSPEAAAMVRKYRTSKILFIRTGDKNSCVRVVTGRGSDGEKLQNSKQVSEYLGLEKNTYGVTMEDVVIELFPDPIDEPAA